MSEGWDWDETKYGSAPELRLYVKVRGIERWMFIRNDIWMGRDEEAPPRTSWELFDRDEVILMALTEAIASFPEDVRNRAMKNAMMRTFA